MNDPQWVSLVWSQLVQITVLAAVVGLLVRTCARQRPHLAYALWLLVLVKCVTPPIWSSPTGVVSFVAIPDLPGMHFFRPPPKRDSPAWTPDNEAAYAIASSPRSTDVAEMSAVNGLGRGYVLEGDGILNLEVPGGNRFQSVLSGEELQRDSPNIPASVSSVLWRAWFLSAGLIFLVTMTRLLIPLRRVYHQRLETPSELEALAARLSERLKLRRKIRILVTASHVGPAVVGWFRPLLILPEVVIAGRSAKELEPIIVHELLHVKRGDLGIGWLQVLVQSLWWFHPLVWLVNRFLSREAERCCDEAVLAELNCSPSFYAHCLLAVLEQKRNLKPLPACPGVKPVELTKQRMERIMRLTQGCRKRSPWWCWLVVLLLSVVVLPGQGRSEDDKTDPADPAIEFRLPEAVLTKMKTKRMKLGRPAAKKPDLYASVYSIEAILEPLEAEYRLDSEDAEAAIELLVSAAIRTFESAQTPADFRGKCLANDGTLVIRADEGVHSYVAGLLKLWEQVGFYHVTLETILARTSIELRADRVSGGIAQQSAILSALSAQKRNELSLTLQEDPRANLIQVPKMTLLNGQRGIVQDTVQRPFVTGMNGEKPLIEVFSDGLEMMLEPKVDAEGTVELEVQLRFSEIRAVTEKPIQTPGARKPVTVQVPDVRTMQVGSRCTIKKGETLLIGGLKTPWADEQESLLVLIRPVLEKLERRHLVGLASTSKSTELPAPIRSVGVDSDAGLRGTIVIDDSNFQADSWPQTESPQRDDPNLRADLAPPAKVRKASESTRRRATKVYPISDLVIPIPPATVEARSARRPAPDAAPLIELIKHNLAAPNKTRFDEAATFSFDRDQLSLVIQASQTDHETIATMLASLRRKQGLQVSIECMTVCFEENSFAEFWAGGGVKVDSRRPLEANVQNSVSPLIFHSVDREAFRKHVDGLEQAKIVSLPKVTTFNGVGVQVAIERGSETTSYMLVPTASNDRRSIHVNFAVNAQSLLETLSRAKSLSLRDAESVLIEVTDEVLANPLRTGVPEVDRALREWKKNELGMRTFVLLTPRIVQE